MSRPRPARFTQNEWQVIAEALSALEAGAYPDEMGMTDDQADTLYRTLRSAGEKVSARLTYGRPAPWSAD